MILRWQDKQLLTTEDGQKLMADPIDKPTPGAKPGPMPHPRSSTASAHQDAALDDAM